MREWDKREVYAVRYADDPDALADDIEDICRRFEWWFIAGLPDKSRGPLSPDVTPIAFVGIWPTGPVSVNVSAIGTDRFNEIALPLTRKLRRETIPWLRKYGITRAECRCLKTHGEAVRWLKLLGAEEECELPGLGKHGETYLQMVWT